MNFDEALEQLNCSDIASVAAEMAHWHPRILGQMLLAVEVAKKARYPLYHPDYYATLRACLAAEPPGNSHLDHDRPKELIADMMQAVKQLEERR